MTFIKQCEKALTVLIDSKLKPLGFKRAGTLYRLETDESIAMLWVQRSRDEVGGMYKFTVNLGAYSHVLGRGRWRPPKIDFGSAHVRARLEASPREQWFLVATDEEMRGAISKIDGLLNDETIRELCSLSTSAGLLAYLRSGKAGGQTEASERHNILTLEASLSNGESTK